MNLIHNERSKLSATCLNTVAAATIVTGVIAPLIAVLLGLPASATTSVAALAVLMVTLALVARLEA